jgi:hypothetical protein
MDGFAITAAMLKTMDEEFCTMDDAKVFFPFSVLGFLIRSFQQVLAYNHPFFVKWSITGVRRR